MRRRAAGFTLVELLVAMLLATLVSLLAYSGLEVAMGTWHATEQRQREMELSYLAQSLLRRLLENPVAFDVRDSEDVQQVAFNGSEQGLIFASHLSSLDDSDKLYWVQLTQDRQLTPKGPNWRLLLRYMPMERTRTLDWAELADDLASSGEEQVVLEGQPRAWQFAYLEQRSDGGEDQWKNEWRQRRALPPLIRLTPGKRTQGVLARLVVAPRETAYVIHGSAARQ
jgi:general secretion pathway protein J